ncbi:T6SS immunity protein Tli4 family protein, partial [Pluralibacter gergoviae]
AEEKKMTDNLFGYTKKQCIGRYIFEVPSIFHNTLTNQVWFNDVQISTKRIYRPAFEQRIKLREEELLKTYSVNQRDNPYLKQVYRLSNDIIIFDKNEDRSVSGASRILEGYYYNNGVEFMFQTGFVDLQDPKYSDKKKMMSIAGVNEKEFNTKLRKLTEMQNLISRLSGRGDEEIPTKPGVCIPNGFVVDGDTQSEEKIYLLYRLKNFSFAVASDNTQPKNNGLLTRVNESTPAMIKAGAMTLKKGAVVSNDINVEEWLVKGVQEIYQPEEKKVTAYRFLLFGNEKITDYKHPVLSIELSNSGLETKDYSDSQLVDIWDRITKTFKYRANAF